MTGDSIEKQMEKADEFIDTQMEGADEFMDQKLQRAGELIERLGEAAEAYLEGFKVVTVNPLKPHGSALLFREYRTVDGNELKGLMTIEPLKEGGTRFRISHLQHGSDYQSFDVHQHGIVEKEEIVQEGQEKEVVQRLEEWLKAVA